ncbi:GMC family oxidoreductase [Nitrospirillum sp. BR 11828]|uniref:GMC family oxidoreductase n=1 Tax=Nitrospirillum sp. BR 11828 TaxID=3104325 RepID=UPI003A0FDF02
MTTAAAEDADIFDYIVVGAGSAGCVLTNRLSADPTVRVALVEAGGKDDWIWFHIPVGYLFAIGNPRADWMFKTEAVPGLNGRSLAYPRGKVLGGCSAINAMIYMRGQAADYDGWRQMGLPGWGWDDVLPTFLAQEDHVAGAGPFHGVGGEWHVDHPRIRWALLDAFIDAAGQCGIPRTEDFNQGDNEGCGYFQVNQKAGRRWSAARAFLDPVRHRPNLTVITGALAERLTFDGTRATGVRLRTPHGPRILAARTLVARREVVVATGAVATPALLERSGIGAGARVRDLGVAVIADRPGVGRICRTTCNCAPSSR